MADHTISPSQTDCSRGRALIRHRAIKLAYGSIPKDCGTFTFYRNLRNSLLAHGIEVFCVTVGQQEAKHWNAAFADDHCVQLAAAIADPRRQAQAFVEWALQEQIHLVMPINSIALLSSLPHLPDASQVVMRCANAFDHGYRITILGQNCTAAIVATTPRHRVDLEAFHGADPRKLSLLPHGVDPAPYETLPARRQYQNLTLGYLGRLEHNQKGALYLPGIVRRLEDHHIPFHLKIAGAGEH
jgi:glycosyltransferase involved in cell wall biosynthesis